MKAVLILDEMPESCRQCGFFKLAKDPCYDVRVCKATGSLMSARAGGSKPNWCPLKELPDFKGISSDDNMIQYGSYHRGWNACLDAILGEED